MEEDSDVIRGRRLTNAESWKLMLPDLPLVDEKILNDILKPFITINEQECEKCPAYEGCVSIAKLQDGTIVKCIYYNKLLEKLKIV